MSRLLRGVLLAAGAAAVCLAALWLSVVAGVWLALHATTGVGSATTTRLVTVAVLAVAIAIVVRAVTLLAGDLHDLGRRR
jgi:hypothetical protein